MPECAAAEDMVAIPLRSILFSFPAVRAFVCVRWPRTGRPCMCRRPRYVPMLRWCAILSRTCRRRSDSSAIERRGSSAAARRCDGGSWALVAAEVAAAVLSLLLLLLLDAPGNADVVEGRCAGIEPGDERYPESAVICVSVSDATFASAWSWSRAQSRADVWREMP